MAAWIEIKFRYNKVMESGAVKKVTESYFVDALSFTEAKARITEGMKPCISGDYEVKAMTNAKIAEVRITEEMKSCISGDYEVKAVTKAEITKVMASDCYGYWYEVRAMFISLDERTGADKLTHHDFMFEANNIVEAIAKFKREITSLYHF